MDIKLTIGERLQDLMKESGITQRELSKELKISAGKMNDIINDSEKDIGYKVFIKIAKYFNVSTDYLLGLTDVKSTDTDIKAICDYTGLSVESVNLLNCSFQAGKFDVLFFDNMIKYRYEQWKFDYAIFNIGIAFEKYLATMKKIVEKYSSYLESDSGIEPNAIQEFNRDYILFENDIDSLNIERYNINEALRDYQMEYLLSYGNITESDLKLLESKVGKIYKRLEPYFDVLFEQTALSGDNND